MEIIDKNGAGHDDPQPYRYGKNMYIGCAVAICGVIWLMYNFGAIPHRFFDRFFSWQTLLMAVGGYFMVFRKWIPGLAVFLTGLAFAMADWYHLSIPVKQVVLPSLLIAAGVAVMLQGRRG